MKTKQVAVLVLAAFVVGCAGTGFFYDGMSAGQKTEKVIGVLRVVVYNLGATVSMFDSSFVLPSEQVEIDAALADSQAALKRLTDAVEKVAQRHQADEENEVADIYVELEKIEEAVPQ